MSAFSKIFGSFSENIRVNRKIIIINTGHIVKRKAY